MSDHPPRSSVSVRGSAIDRSGRKSGAGALPPPTALFDDVSILDHARAPPVSRSARRAVFAALISTGGIVKASQMAAIKVFFGRPAEPGLGGCGNLPRHHLAARPNAAHVVVCALYKNYVHYGRLHLIALHLRVVLNKCKAQKGFANRPGLYRYETGASTS